VRERGGAVDAVMAQLDGSLPDSLEGEGEFAISYEPIWAIGTGKIPTTDEIREMQAAVRAKLCERYGSEGAGIRILYGGSVNASNAGEIFSIPEVDGALVGGASLKAADFMPIVAAAAVAGE
jgi:triosephosphate isomerase